MRDREVNGCVGDARWRVRAIHLSGDVVMDPVHAQVDIHRRGRLVSLPETEACCVVTDDTTCLCKHWITLVQLTPCSRVEQLITCIAAFDSKR